MPSRPTQPKTNVACSEICHITCTSRPAEHEKHGFTDYNMASDVLAQELCVEATALWLSGEFDSALQTLQRVEDASSDAKVCVVCLS